MPNEISPNAKDKCIVANSRYYVFMQVFTIKRDSPSHDGLCVIMTRRRRFAPCLVFRITACSPSLPDVVILA
ncbi:MAG: hypothetical protein ACI30S_00595 [Muribaculaceae bacterium]